LYIPVNISHLENGWSDRLLLQKLAFGLPPAELAKYRVAKSTTSSSQAPSTALEKKIHTLWKGLLNIDQIGVEDNFFRLGGGSVLAMRLVSMARREGITMTVSGIFKTPTLRELALTVQEDTDVIDIAAFSLLDSSSVADLKRQAAAQCAVTEEEIEDIYPCSAMQLHYITGYPGANKTMHDPWDWQSQATYSLSPTIDLDRFIAAWNVAISRHLTLRTMILNTSSGILQVVLTEPKEPVWHYAKNLHQYEEDDKANAMGFGTPLLRLGIISTPGSEQRHFVMTIHHTIYDAFARSMLFKEIESLYESPNSLSTGSLPKMNIFIKYITTDADKTSALDFWASKLSDLTTKPLLKIPEHPILPLEIQEHTVTTPLSRPNSKTYTLPTLLEVAVAITLSHHLSTPTVILYSDRSGRNLPVPGLTDLIGPTTLLLPVPITISPDQTIQSLLESAQHFQTEMLPHEHLGFVELLELPTLAPTLKNAINMNINPRRLAGMGKGLGLTFEGSSAGCDDPFGINVDVDEEVRELSWCVYWDERFIEKESVKALLGDVIRTFEKLVEGNGGRKVSEVWG
jgi:aryl carrier-like protein